MNQYKFSAAWLNKQTNTLQTCMLIAGFRYRKYRYCDPYNLFVIETGLGARWRWEDVFMDLWNELGEYYSKSRWIILDTLLLLIKKQETQRDITWKPMKLPFGWTGHFKEYLRFDNEFCKPTYKLF